MLLIILNFVKSALSSLPVAMHVLATSLLNTLSKGKTEVLLLEGETSSVVHQLKSKLVSSIKTVGYQVMYSPVLMLNYVLKNCITLYKNIIHYYFNFYKKGRPIRTLFPAYQDITIHRIMRLIVTGFTGEKFSYFNAFKLVIKFIIRWSISLFLATLTAIVLYALRDVPVNKFLFICMSVGFFTYLLISGFVFFLKKYRYSKYTTAMHRYWRRTLSIFWLLEGFLFCVFLYLAIFSSQEPFFGYDNPQFMKDFTYPWRLFTQETSMLIFIIIITRYALVRLKDIAPFKLYTIILTVTLLFLSMAWGEFYQFYYILNHYNALDWVFDEDTGTWSLDYETKKTRILLHFITICVIAKFWHFAFILIFWMFSVSRWIQSERVHYSLFSSNLQHFIILYLLNWIVMYPWFKYAFRRHLYKNYTWMYTNFRNTGSRIFFMDLVNYGSTILESINPFSYPIILHVIYGYFYSCWYGTGAVFSIDGYLDFLGRYALTGEY